MASTNDMQCFMQCLGGGERGFDGTLIVLRDSPGPSSTPEYAQISSNLNIMNIFCSSLWEDCDSSLGVSSFDRRTLMRKKYHHQLRRK